jgi:hypothetical protein
MRPPRLGSTGPVFGLILQFVVIVDDFSSKGEASGYSTGALPFHLSSGIVMPQSGHNQKKKPRFNRGFIQLVGTVGR